MLNEKIDDTLKIAKELFKHSVLNDDEYTQDKLWQIIVNISSFKDQTFGNKSNGSVLTEDNEVEKVQRKIPRWLKNPTQYNSIILNTYMSMSNNNEHPVVLDTLEETTGMDRKQFLTNYTQMKIIAEKNHAKVFTEESGVVYLWKPVSEFIEDLYEGVNVQLFDRISKRTKDVNNERIFKQWLINDAKKDNEGSLDSGTIGTILSTLRSTIPKELKIDSILELNDLDTVNDYLHKIETSDFNIDNHYKPKQALKFYMQFLKNEKGIN